MSDATLRLVHTPFESMIELRMGRVKRLFYDRKIHHYESESDFKTLNTELQTYGIDAMMELWEYIASKR